MDWDQHYRFKENIERDKKKDKMLKEIWYEILRIRWKNMINDTKK